jgi:GDP-4-dehydro-6-deoxy-D-mannose reductase
LARVLVTGGGGFAGLHLLRELRRRGEQEIAATMLGELPDPTVAGVAGVEWLAMDVTSTDSVEEVVHRVQPEEVYHLAGQASVGASFDAPLLTWEVNATGTLRLLTVLGRDSPGTKRVLLASSAEVYGAVPTERQPIREDAPYRPTTPYGASKAAAELVALQTAGSGGIEVVVARAFNHIGPGQDERFVMPSMARQLARLRGAAEKPSIRVGNLEVYRDFLDVRDVAAAYVLLMPEGNSGEAYNVCRGESQSLHHLVLRLVELSGTGAELVVDQERVRPADIPRLEGDPERLRRLGWSPEWSLDQTLRDLLAEAGSLS